MVDADSRLERRGELLKKRIQINAELRSDSGSPIAREALRWFRQHLTNEITRIDTHDTLNLQRVLTRDLIARVDTTERNILKSLGLPAVPVKVFDVASGKEKLPKRRGRYADQRVNHAMQTLVLLEQVRRHMIPGHENVAAAVHDAMLAGMYANDAGVKAISAAGKVKGGVARSKQKTNDAAVDRRRFKTLRNLDEDLKTADIAKRFGRHPDTVRKALKENRP